MPEFAAVSPGALPARLARWLADRPGVVRVGIDGAPAAGPGELAEALREPLQVLGRPLVHVRTDSFWRDASLRFEYGREDPDAYLNWLDDGALRREVLSGDTYLPSLRDPATNRSTRAEAQALLPEAVLVVSGAFLQGLGLPFDRVVHLLMSPAARARRTDPAQAWTLPAFERYDDEVGPAELADVVITLEDPRHPAVRGLP